MRLLWELLVLQSFMVCLADDNTLHGPVFLQEPNSVIFPLDSEEKKVKLSCEVKGNPRPTIGWKLNGTSIDIGMDYRYSVVEGNLLINNPNKTQDTGTYQCVATNPFGTIVSREAKLQFAYLENFKTRTRSTVSVRQGQGMVLLCGPPPHSGVMMGTSWAGNSENVLAEEIQAQLESLRREKGELEKRERKERWICQDYLEKVKVERQKIASEFKQLRQYTEEQECLLLAGLGELEKQIETRLKENAAKSSMKVIYLDGLIKEKECQQSGHKSLQDAGDVLSSG